MKRYPILGLLLLCCGCVGLFAQPTEHVYLSGHDKDDAVPWRFQVTSGRRAGEWTTLPVPSQWDVQGFGTLNYRTDAKEAANEEGHYETEFSAPTNWGGRRVFLVFEGVMTDTTAQVNGQVVGPTHQGGFYRFKYEITSALTLGATNKLEVTVARHSANDSVNHAERAADYWVLAGIYRPVYLEIVPPQFVDRVAIDARADGEFRIDVFTDGAPSAALDVQLETLSGEPVGGPVSATTADGKATLRTKVTSPRLWTAETPHLYRARVRLQHAGKVVHEYSQRFGFRTFEVRDGDGLYLNGQRVVLKGANRHSFWPDSGRTLSDQVHRLDLETIKDANMNAVRMSHYPPDQQFLDLCDELGVYVLDELAGWHQFYDDAIGAKLVREMVVRDVNHPSIVFWDNGNEDGSNPALDPLFGELDPQGRRVLHPWNTFGGVDTSHYLVWDWAQKAVAGVPLYSSLKDVDIGYTRADEADPRKYIYMPTEYQHGLYDGGAGAGFDDYWRLMTSSRYLGGGFVWTLFDEGLKRFDNGQIDNAGNQAPDGIVGPYRQREGSFFTIKEVWSPIQVTRAADGMLTIENHYGFTPASACRFRWELRRFARWDGPVDQPAFAVLQQGVAEAPAIAPGGSGQLRLKLPADSAADALALRVDDPSGRELWTWVWPLREIEAIRPVAVARRSQPQISETGEVIQVTSGDLAVSISRSTAQLVEVRQQGHSYSLTQGPKLATGQSGTVQNITATTESSGDVVVTAQLAGDLKQVVWRVRSDGWLQCHYTYAANGSFDYTGVTFEYPEPLVQHKRWLGEGPFHVWKNRLRGTTVGVWENDYNNTLTGFSGWIYPEFKGFFAGVRWLQLTTAEGQITVVPGNVPFVQVLTPDFPTAKLVGQSFAPVPKCGLGFLDAISPIGSKFKKARDLGPQGQPNELSGEFSATISFRFGAP